ncbi:hypothetical protein MNBD_ALPHA11-2504 [hydrothermal vent metagenome]|uniref:Uncharacterized protein n=1 Tax=hydrothermal vent metagenome TaxID=652676 RepID=A0A3B0UAU0_9ZZZZ
MATENPHQCTAHGKGCLRPAGVCCWVLRVATLDYDRFGPFDTALSKSSTLPKPYIPQIPNRFQTGWSKGALGFLGVTLAPNA